MILVRQGRRTGISKSSRIPGLILLLAMSTLTACTDFGTNFQVIDPEGVAVYATKDKVVIRNGSPARIYHFIVAADIQPLIDWAPLCNAENAIDPGVQKEIPYGSIFGYTKECDVVAYWWHAVSVSGGFPRADSLRIIHVKTQ